MSHEFRIKPLSEGLGLGTLRTNATRRVQRQESARPTPQRPTEMPTIEIERPGQHHEQHQPPIHQEVFHRQDASAQLKNAPKARVGSWFARAIIGWGLDGFMVATTVAMCAILGLMAWRFGAGYTETIDPLDAIGIIVKFISRQGFKLIGVVIAVAWILYWVVMKALVGSTLGSTLSGSGRVMTHGKTLPKAPSINKLR